MKQKKNVQCNHVCMYICNACMIKLTHFPQVTPMSDRDFGRYNCTARNNIGMRFQEFILAQAGECLEQIQIIHVITVSAGVLPA